jgi:hypothetical protein
MRQQFSPQKSKQLRVAITPMRKPEQVANVVKGAGHALDDRTRALMESRFAYDFSRVRVHTDGAAAESARAVDAAAYTVKNHIVFASGRYQPRTASGLRLLAHELAHTVQQDRGQSRRAAHKGTLERGAEAAEAAFDRGAAHISDVHGSGVAVLRKEGDPAKPSQNEVRVIADKGAGKLRVVLVSPKGELVAGLAEITPSRGASLDPGAISVYQQQVSGERYPQVRVQTPSRYQASVNVHQDVKVGEAPADDAHTVTMAEQAEQDRAELVKYLMDNSDHFPEIALRLKSYYETAPIAEIEKAIRLPDFVEWKARRDHDQRIAEENAYYQRALGPAGQNVDPAQAREIYETYNPPEGRTPYEKDRIKAGVVEQDIIRDPRTGERVGYRERHLYGERSVSAALSKYHSLEFNEEYTRDIAGNLTGGRESGGKTVYAPWDYVLDPLQLQEMAGLAESDPAIAVASDLATGGIKAGVRGAARGVKALANTSKRAAGKEVLEGLTRASEREIERGLVIHPSQVAESVEHQAARAESKALQSAAHEASAVEKSAAHAEGGAGKPKASQPLATSTANAPGSQSSFFKRLMDKMKGPLVGPTAGRGKIASRLNQVKSRLKNAVSSMTGGSRPLIATKLKNEVINEFRQTFDPAIAEALAVEMIEKTPGREVGIWRNAITDEHVIVQGTGDWIDGAVNTFPVHGGPWELVEHYHPERNFAVSLPSPSDFIHVEALAQIQQGGNITRRVSSKVRYRDPVTKTFHFTEYGIDPTLRPPLGPYFVRAIDAHGMPMEYSFTTLNEWQAQIHIIEVQGAGSGAF